MTKSQAILIPEDTKEGLHLSESPMALDMYNKRTRSQSPTLTDPKHNAIRITEHKKIRRLTEIECERLQGFPDNWTEGISSTQRYKSLGNAVSVPIVKMIIERLYPQGEPK